MSSKPILDTSTEAIENTTALDDSMKQFLRQEQRAEESFAFANLLKNFNITTNKTDQLEVNAETVFERCSPVKMIGLLRPSTVYEEESDSSSCLQDSGDAELHTEKLVATSFETAPAQTESFKTCDSFMPATTFNKNTINNDPAHYDVSCFVTAASKATSSSFRSFETPACRPTMQETSSEATSHDTIVGRPTAEFSRDSLLSTVDQDSGFSAKPRDFSVDSLVTSASRERSLDDTLEMVEYVSDSKDSKYMLKPIRKLSTSSSPQFKQDVIEIDSSPETSYRTAHTHLHQNELILNEICSYPPKKSRTFYGSDFDELCTSLTSTSMKAAANRPTDIACTQVSDVINLSDSFGDDENEPPHDQAAQFIKNRYVYIL